MQVVLSLAPGGTERLVVDIVRYLHANGAGSMVCCLDDEGAWAQQVRDLGSPVVALHRKPGFQPALGRAISRLAHEHEIDLVHCHHYSSFVYGQLSASLWSGPPVVFTEHGRLSDAPPSRKRRLVNPLIGRLPSAVYAVSADLREHMVGEGFPRSKVTVLHNGIDPGPPVSNAQRAAARATLALPPDAVLVGTVGRLDPVKDFGTLIRGFAAARNVLPNARLVIVGDGPERASLEAVARASAVDRKVIFTGHRQDVRGLLPAFDIFVNSSVHEGISLTILEAMAAGIPVVVTAVGGNPEVVTSDTGVLVPPRSPESIAKAVIDLAQDRPTRHRLGLAGRARVENCFSAERMLGDYLKSYQRHQRVTRRNG
jgi:glycosyltransferase involved in cell wall biosynthesis